MPPDVDTLAAEWCDALDASNASIHSAALYLKAAELAPHQRRIDADRMEVAKLLGQLARDRHRPALLVRWLATPRHTRAMLGLPEELMRAFSTSTACSLRAMPYTPKPGRMPSTLLLARRPPRGIRAFDRCSDYEDHLAGRPRLQGLHSFLAARGLSLPEGKPDDPPGIDTVAAIVGAQERSTQCPACP